MVRHTVRQADFLFKVDLTDAYFTCVRIHVFSVWPQCQRESSWIFTKLIKVAVTSLRRFGIRLVIYLENLLIVGATAKECNNDVIQVIAVL